MKLTKAAVAVSTLGAQLAKVIDRWSPAELPTELKYRDALLSYLRGVVPGDCQIEREYRHKGTTTDLYVRWAGIVQFGEAFVEVKRNLDKKTTLDRLVGQLESLSPGENAIVVVLVGSVDDALLGRLRARYRHLSDPMLGQPLAIIVKRNM